MVQRDKLRSSLWHSSSLFSSQVGVEAAPPIEKHTSLAENLSSAEFVAAWKEIVETNHLQPADLSAITTGAYADWILGNEDIEATSRDKGTMELGLIL